jgi:hypothetical protein
MTISLIWANLSVFRGVKNCLKEIKIIIDKKESLSRKTKNKTCILNFAQEFTANKFELFNTQIFLTIKTNVEVCGISS